MKCTDGLLTALQLWQQCILSVRSSIRVSPQTCTVWSALHPGCHHVILFPCRVPCCFLP